MNLLGQELGHENAWRFSGGIAPNNASCRPLFSPLPVNIVAIEFKKAQRLRLKTGCTLIETNRLFGI